MIIEIRMPALSPTMTAGKLIKWNKKVGDKIKSGDILFEVETDKSTMEYECVEEGQLRKIFVNDGEENVEVNRVVAIFSTPSDTDADIENYKLSEVTKKSTETVEEKTVEQSTQSPIIINNIQDEKMRLKVSPIARKIADEKGLELFRISGTGFEGRIIKSDVMNQNLSLEGKTFRENSKQDFTRGTDSKIQISGIRKVIADRLLFSKTTIPHFYLNTDCIVDDLIKSRKTLNENLGLKITINDLIVKAVAYAMAKFPEINRCWGGDHIVQCGNVDIAVAVDIPDGLITPIVRDANRLSITELSENLKDLIVRARASKLKPAEYQGGSLTISNLGMFGVKSFFAIVNPPHASILSIGGVSRKPIVEEEDQIKIRSVMDIGISSDHRIVDGALAAKFLNEIKKFIENPVLFLI